MRRGYRPANTDFHPRSENKMSLREAGQFDKKFLTESGHRLITTGWTAVCLDRQTRGISRKARIRAARAA